MLNMGNLTKRQIAHSVQSIQAGLKVVASRPELYLTPASSALVEGKPDPRQALLENLVKSFPFAQRMVLFNLRGNVEISSDSKYSNEHDLTARHVVQPEVAQPLLDNTTSPPCIQIKFYQPMWTSEGKSFGVLRADVALTEISDILENARFGEKGAFVLLDSLQHILYHRNPDKLYTPFHPDGINFQTNQDREEFFQDGRTLIFDTIDIPPSESLNPTGWTLITTMDKTEAMTMVRQIRWTALGIGTGSIILTGLVALYFANTIAKPVANASKAARAVAAGNMQMRLQNTGAEELRELASAFNQMTYKVLQHQEKLELLVESRTYKLQQSQRSLEETTAELHAANDATKEGMFVVNRAGEVLTANRQMGEIFGLGAERLRNRPLAEIRDELSLRFRLADDFTLAWEDALANQAITSETEWSLVSPGQKTVSIYTAPVLDAQGQVIARLWMFRDITTQRLLEDSLRQAQKMEAVGRLAGGVAHDFNNLLQGILGNLFIVQQDPELRRHEDMRRCVHSARSAGQRAAELVKGLLGFSRQTHLSLGRCDVNDVLEATQTLVRPTFDPRIIILTDLQEGIWGLNADSNQIEQVIMNMIMNAKDAMPKGGNLLLTTRNIVIAEERVELIPGSRPGEYVRISINDEGSGMSEEVRSKIFEPFFTTKEQGRGTGLGLATSFGIVQQHGGWINCDTAVGQGTTFHIFLPRNEVNAAEPVVLVDPPKPVGGQETILIVDDEMVVRAVAEAILKKYGYKIITACDGEEALDKLARHDGEIDLVLMDMTMPRLSGMDTFRHMRKGQAPNVPVVICSGYLVDHSGFAEETGSIPNGFLQKPYEIDDMSRTVRRVLDEMAAAKVR
jgi:two-component system cell cycle sensor histidine kinase/response regulator CckA